jgi:diacylglycerol kinase
MGAPENFSVWRIMTSGWRDEMQSRYRSFTAAFRGLFWLIRSERHFQIHVAAAILAVLLGLALGLSPVEWAILLVTIGLVLVAEAINTAIEYAIDLTIQQVHPLARIAKDVGAAAVLVSAVISVLVGSFLFLPKMIAFLHR